MTIAAVSAVRSTAAIAPAAPASAPVVASAAPPAYNPYGGDQFVSSGYVSGEAYRNVVYGETKNAAIRIINRQLNLQTSYLEAAFIDKTPQNAMAIEDVDFDLQVKAGEVSLTDVSATLTVDEILRRKATNSGKAMPVSDLRVAFDPNNQVRIEGKYTAPLGIKLPFSVTGTVNVDTAGYIRYDLGQAKVAGIKVNGLMNTFGLTLDKLLKFRTPMQDGYYTEGNALVVNLGQTVSQLDGAPGLNANIRGVRTHLGQLQILVGETPADAQRALAEKALPGPAYINAAGGHAYIDGFFLKEGQVSIYDRTPGSPLNINARGGEPERNIKLHSGYVGVTQARFTELIKDEIGDTDAIQDLSIQLTDETAKVKGKLFGAVGVSLNMTFTPSANNQLKFTPSNAKAFGFIPIPGGIVSPLLQKVVKSGQPDGKGVVIPQMNGMDLGKITHIDHQNGYIVMAAGDVPVAPIPKQGN